jgi:hypothetical protein
MQIPNFRKEGLVDVIGVITAHSTVATPHHDEAIVAEVHRLWYCAG